jgi:TonB-linked SusC/RagA family outer membrane protein
LPEYATGEIGNPVALLETFKGDTKQDKLLGTFYAKISPFKGFEFTSRLGIDMAYQNQHSWAPKYFISAERNNAVNTIDDNNNKWYTWLLENFATYHNVIGDHDFTLLAGYSAQSYKNNYYYLHSGPMVKEGDIYADHSSTTSRSSDRVAGTTTESTMASVFGRLSYSFKNKYMFEASFRNDGASEFPTEQKYGFFPAFSAGWVVSEESFGKIPGMDYMKIRASWGQNGSKSNLVGNEDKELWTFGGIQYPKNGGGYYPGSEINTLPNDKLVWERSEQTDFGVDLKFFNSSLSVSADYFNKLTKDLIINGTGPLSVGQDLPRINGGTVSNKGFEIELGYRGEVGELGYAVNMNMSFLKNEVTDMSVKTPIKGDNLRGYDLTWFSMNQPIWYFKGYKVSGIDPKTGDPIVVDTDGKPGISDADQTYIGDPHPDMIFGANVQLDYKGFDFSMFLQGTQGNDVFMGWFRSDRATSNKPAFFFEDRWTPTNTNASMPKANNTSDYIYRSSLMVQDGSYIRIKQIQLGYTLPKDLLTKFKISTVRAYVSLEDYFTFTKYQGLDPEAGSSNNQRQGVDRGLYPIAGKLMFGLNLSF